MQKSFLSHAQHAVLQQELLQGSASSQNHLQQGRMSLQIVSNQQQLSHGIQHPANNQMGTTTHQLPNGELSILVDVGAWTNLQGKTLARAFVEKAATAGYTSTQTRMPSPLTIMGVGDGTQTCTWQSSIPVPIESDDGDSAEVVIFESPTVEGTGSDLPTIIGLKSMKNKKGVLELEDGHERLSFPGPGGYTMNWSPGTKHFKLRRAPSGHLVIPLS